jgi:hypothetical protein
MSTNNEILMAVEHLTEKLYGQNGFEGDIPEIKKLVRSNQTGITQNTGRIIKMETQCDERTLPTRYERIKNTGRGIGWFSIIIYMLYNIGVHIHWWG